jgi:hypothetical protein
MAYEVNNPEIQALLKQTAESISKTLPQGWGFTLLLYQFHGEGDSLFYISNAQRKDMMHTFREFLGKQDIDAARPAVGGVLTPAQERVAAEIFLAISFLQKSPVFRYECDLLIDCAHRMRDGGTFVKLLGEMFFRADGANQQKLLSTWPGYFLEYAE